MAQSRLPERFGKYHVLGRIAQGGMAEIYRVKTVGIAGFEKVQALKRILPGLAAQPRFLRAFIDEARIAVSLNHRNIVQVFDFGRAAGDLYLSMELIEGVDLRSAVHEAAAHAVGLPLALSCYICGEVAAGLDYAHRKTDAQRRSLGIVHCDVSPQNVMLSREGFVKILDFGVARAGFAATPVGRRLRGKPRYMAPEQARGDTPVAATDVFALGIVAWELLTGMPLFDGADVDSILAAVKRTDVPPPDRLNPDVPEGLSHAVARALSPAPADRGSAARLGAAFVEAMRGLGGAGARDLAAWLDRVLPAADAPQPTLVTPPPGDATDTVIDAALPADPAAELAALLDRRRVVAVAARVDGGAGGDEAARELLRGLSALAYKRGAVIHREEEAEILALFGLEVAGEDDVAHAMAYALDAVDLARETAHGRGAGAAAAVRIAARAGIVAQRRREGGYQLVGDAVEEARTLARAAEPGHPLLAGAAGRLATAHFRFRELPAQRPRSRRLRVLELLGPRGHDERRRALRERRGRFVGRGEELARLEAAAARARRERRRVTVMVVGPAGVGKSRLVAEFVGAHLGEEPGDGRDPGASDSSVVRPLAGPLVAVAAIPTGRDAPYSMVIDLLQAALDLAPGRGETARARLAQRLRRVLERHHAGGDEVSDAVAAVDLAAELRDGAAAAAPGATADLRERVAAAIAAVRATTTGEPLRVTVIEDLHHADGASADVLRSSLGGPPVPGAELLLVTARRDPGRPAAAIAADEVIELDELPAGERLELIRDRIGDAAGDDAVAAVARRAGGNPLFIEELAAAVRETGPAEIPATARDVILARVDRLPAGARTALQYAAVAGPTFRARILEELLGDAVQDPLRELLDEGLLVRADAASVEAEEGELAFAHGLLQEAVYESLSVAARRDTHVRLGRLLESRHRAGRDEPPAALARHLELGGDAAGAAGHWLRAGEVALTAADLAAAVAAFGRALELDVGAAEEPGRRARRWAALAGRETAYGRLGEHAAQARDLEELERLAAGDPRGLADVANRAAARLLRLGDYAAAVAASEQAEQAADAAADEPARGEALRLRAEAYERLCRFDLAVEAVQRSLDVLRRAGAGEAETRALIGLGRIHLFACRYEAALAAYGPALERVLATGDPWLERIVRNNLAVTHCCMGELERAMVDARRSLAICQRFGDRAREGDNLSVVGIVLLEVGQVGDAREHLARALAMHDATGSRWSRADTLVYAGLAELARGDADGALARVEEAAGLARAIGAPYLEGSALVARSAVLLARGDEGDLEAALAAAASAAALGRDAQLPGVEVLGLARQAQALLRLGRDGDARGLSEQAVTALERQGYIEGSEEEVLYTHYQVLSSLDVPDAAVLLDRARAGLERKLALLAEPAWRESFAAIPLHSEILGTTGAAAG